MISFIYFDIGGVIIKDFSASNKWNEMKLQLGVTTENEVKFSAFWNRYSDRFDIDQDLDELIPLLRSELSLDLPEGFSWLDAFIDRFEPNYSLWSVIEKINQTNRIGLLTNMYPRMLSGLEASGLIPPTPWETVIDSSEVKLKKPNPEIYRLAQKRVALPAEEILFIDNSIANLAAAKALGWQTFLYNSAEYEKSSAEINAFLAINA